MLLLNQFSHTAHAVFISLSFLCLLSCGEDRHLKDLKQYVNQSTTSTQSTSKKNSLIDNLPKSVEYRPEKNRSPFEETTESPTGVQTGSLQAFPLTLLKLKGIADQNGVTWAYIEAPDDHLYTIKKGDKIGDHMGTVVAITDNSIEIDEPILTSNTQGAKRIVTLQLKDEN